MKRKMKSFLWILLITMILSPALIRVGFAQPSATRVYVDPETVVMDPDGFFTVDIKIEGALHVVAWQFELYYDATILFTQYDPTDPTKQWVTVDDFLSSPFFTASVYPGHVAAEALSMSFSESSGSGTLASVKFQVIGTGRTILNLRNSDMLDLYMTEGQPDAEEDGEFYTTIPRAEFVYSTEDHPVTTPGVQPSFKPVVNETITFNATFIDLNGAYAGSYDPDTMTPADPDGAIISYAWDFGDGNTTTVVDPVITHTYNSTGSYKVNLTVTDNATKQDFFYRSLQVVIHDLTIINMEVTPTKIRPGETATIDVTVLNKGTETEAGFNVTTYYDSALLWYNETAGLSAYSSPLIWNEEIHIWGITLDPFESIIITWIWNTTGLVEGTYHIWANVSRVQATDPTKSVPGETLLADNEYHFGDVLLTYGPRIARVDIAPDTLNLKSKGQWITAYIQLPEEYNPEDIDATTILLNGAIQPIMDPKYDFVTNSSEYLVDHNGDGILERMVKFNRTEVASWICDDLGIQYGYVALTITGELSDGTQFVGTDTIKVLFPGDADDDGDVDFDDLYIFSGCYGISIENPSYNPLADFNEDGDMNYEDLVILSENYGKTTV